MVHEYISKSARVLQYYYFGVGSMHSLILCFLLCYDFFIPCMPPPCSHCCIAPLVDDRLQIDNNESIWHESIVEYLRREHYSEWLPMPIVLDILQHNVLRYCPPSTSTIIKICAMGMSFVFCNRMNSCCCCCVGMWDGVLIVVLQWRGLLHDLCEFVWFVWVRRRKAVIASHGKIRRYP